jgi:hypothetical protein
MLSQSDDNDETSPLFVHLTCSLSFKSKTGILRSVPVRSLPTCLCMYQNRSPWIWPRLYFLWLLSFLEPISVALTTKGITPLHAMGDWGKFMNEWPKRGKISYFDEEIHFFFCVPSIYWAFWILLQFYFAPFRPSNSAIEVIPTIDVEGESTAGYIFTPCVVSFVLPWHRHSGTRNLNVTTGEVVHDRYRTHDVWITSPIPQIVDHIAHLEIHLNHEFCCDYPPIISLLEERHTFVNWEQ